MRTLLLLSLCLPALASAQVYKCQSPQGVVSYSAQPCMAGQTAQTMGPANVSVVTQDARQRQQAAQFQHGLSDWEKQQARTAREQAKADKRREARQERNVEQERQRCLQWRRREAWLNEESQNAPNHADRVRAQRELHRTRTQQQERDCACFPA